MNCSLWVTGSRQWAVAKETVPKNQEQALSNRHHSLHSANLYPLKKGREKKRTKYCQLNRH